MAKNSWRRYGHCHAAYIKRLLNKVLDAPGTHGAQKAITEIVEICAQIHYRARLTAHILNTQLQAVVVAVMCEVHSDCTPVHFVRDNQS